MGAGVKLAEPRTAAEDAALIAQYGANNYWMGINDLVEEDKYNINFTIHCHTT